MLDTHQAYQVAVIDEAQMFLDPSRGWAWTQAFLQVQTERLYLLGSPGIKTLIRSLSEFSGEPLEIATKKRISPLYCHKKTVPPHEVPDGSIFVVFSRNAVIRWSEIFRSQGRRVAHIYGAMPPEVRREEARRFREWEANILIATDAIAMGLNLPARTVILAESTKFDGVSMGKVPLPLVRQIIGRAGRFGHHEEGFCAGIDGQTMDLVRKAHASPDPDHWNGALYLQPSSQWLQQIQEAMPHAKLQQVIRLWQDYTTKQKGFSLRTPFGQDALSMAQVLDDPVFADIPLAKRFSLLAAPVAMREGHLSFFRELLLVLFFGAPLDSAWSTITGSIQIEDWERLYKKAELYSWFHYRYPSAFPDIEEARNLRGLCVHKIQSNIRKGVHRTCRECGARLSPRSKHAICDTCFHQRNRYFTVDWI